MHNSYGHLYVQVNQPSIAPLGEAVCNTELFRRLAARMGFDDPCFHETDEQMARAAFRRDDARMQGLEFEALVAAGFKRLNVPDAYAPFANGDYPTRSGKCEFWSETMREQGEDPLPAVILPRECAATNPALASRYPLACISPPARNFLNSSFANLPAFVAEEKGPRLLIHPDDAAPREITEGETVRIRNDRGAFVATGRGDAARTAGRRRCAVDLVAQARAWRRERQRRDLAGADRPRPRRDVLRLSGRGGARRRMRERRGRRWAPPSRGRHRNRQ